MDFSVVNEEEAVGPGFLVLNLERTWASGFWDPQNVGGATSSQSCFPPAPRLTPRNYNSLAPVRLSALYVTSFSAALSARVQGTMGLNRALPQPRPLHPSSPRSPRAAEATRGLRLPAYVARTRPICPVDCWETESEAFPPAFTARCSVLEVPASSAAF